MSLFLGLLYLYPCIFKYAALSFHKNKFKCEIIYLQHFYSTVKFLKSKRYSPLHTNANIQVDLCNTGKFTWQ